MFLYNGLDRLSQIHESIWLFNNPPIRQGIDVLEIGMVGTGFIVSCV